MSGDSREDQLQERADESAADALDSGLVRATDLLRAARRFAGFGSLCWVVMLFWIVAIDGPRASHMPVVANLIIVLAGGFSIALALRAAGQMRRELESATLMARQGEQKVDRQTRDRGADLGKASELLAGISHELRVSLQSMIGILQVAIDTEVNAARANQIGLALRSAHALLGTVEAAVDFSNLEAGRCELEPVYFSIRELLADALEPLGINAAEKGLTLAYAVAAEIPDRLWADPLRLRQIIVNLVGNAVKFTSQGEVVVRISCKTMSAREVTTIIDVSYTGAAIGPLVRPQPFQSGPASNSSTRRPVGSALGLAIASRLVEAMGGTVTVESEQAEGSSFRVILSFPCEPIGTELRPGWEKHLADVRVLLIEPNATTRSILAEILRAYGIVPEAYATLDRALEPSIRAAYQCLVADANVLATTPWIPPVPVVRIASPLAPPATDSVFVTRPVREGALIDAIGFVLGLTGPGIAYSLERRTDITRPLRVLVVAGNRLDQEVLTDAVRRLGHVGTVATTAAEAHDMLLRGTFDVVFVHVVFVQVQTSDLDGLEVARRFRAVERKGGGLSLVAFTAHAESDVRDLCMAAGFDAVLSTAATSGAIGAVLRQVTSSLKPPSEDSVHLDSVLEAVGGNVRVLRRVRDAFAMQIPRLIGAVHNAIEANDREALFHATRALREAIANFDVPAAIAASLHIERVAEAGDFAQAATLMSEIETVLRELDERMAAALK